MLLHAGAPLAPHDLRGAWSLEAQFTLPLAASAAWYVAGVRALWRRAGVGRGLSRGAVGAFATGWLLVAIALVSPLHALGGVLFSAHMAQHELLMVAAAPLLVLGRPLVAGVWAMPRRWRAPLGAAAHAPWVARTWRALAAPVHAWWLHLAAILVWHVPALYQATLRSELAHAAQHVSFFGSALLFWWAVLHVGHARRGVAVGLLFGAMMLTGTLGAVLTFAGRLWYPDYAATTAAWGLMPLEDQRLGGMIMWMPGGIAYLVAALALVARALGDGRTASVAVRAPPRLSGARSR